MKQVTLKEITLVNFKGLRECTVEFNAGSTDIMGRNGSGKTTIFDAFTWLLFGKDSSDRKTFNIKTLDGQGKVIERLPHEVTAVVNVDGKDITLTRRFIEEWVKKRGSSVEEFKGNKEERLYNDVPCSVKDWSEKIDVICPEQVFKFITNPMFFTSQKPDVQRQMLIRMAGGISDEEVAEDNDDFKCLLAQLTGKTLDEYKREIAAKKRKVKQELDGIPERIDERRRSAPKEENWAELESMYDETKVKIAQIEKRLMSQSEELKAFNERKKKAVNQLSKLRTQYNQVVEVITSAVMEEYTANETCRRNLQNEIDSKTSDNKFAIRQLQDVLHKVDEKSKDVEELREEWKRVNTKEMRFGDGDFICPTCGRPLEVDDIEKKQREMLDTFNRAKSDRLAQLSQDGKSIKKDIAELRAEAERLQKHISDTDAVIDDKKREIERLPVMDKPDVSKAVENNEGAKILRGNMADLEAVISEEYKDNGREEMEGERIALQKEAEGISTRLNIRETIHRNNKRIAELESMMHTQSVELAKLEGIEFTIAEFSKSRIEAVEQKINALFNVVRFKMFDKQINGGEVETCEAMVNGVPFSDLNNAGKINAGLDIINAICKSENIHAPIFVDNAEAVNELIKTDSQLVRLVVTEDKELIYN